MLNCITIITYRLYYCHLPGLVWSGTCILCESIVECFKYIINAKITLLIYYLLTVRKQLSYHYHILIPI